MFFTHRATAIVLCVQSAFMLAACQSTNTFQRHKTPLTTSSSPTPGVQGPAHSARCPQLRLLCFSGSSRKDSFNKKLARLACNLARQRGVSVTFVDLTDFPMPLYNGDYEAKNGLPPEAVKFKSLVKQHDALMIASPEYNALPTPLLLNVLDWASRPGRSTERHGAAFAGKTVLTVAASPGLMGGVRSLMSLRSLLEDLRLIVHPRPFRLARARAAFGENGELLDEKEQRKLEKIIDRFVEFATKRLQKAEC